MSRLWRLVLGGLVAAVPLAAWSDVTADRLARGKYLMDSVVACGNCHVQRGPQGEPLFERGLSGGFKFDAPPFTSYAANITPDAETGIGRWTEAQLVKAIREGVRPDGSLIGWPMPIEYYRHLSDDDVAALVAYLRAQPAVANAVPKSVYRIPLPASYGPPVGKVKAPPAKDLRRYGEYLANIAHCMECHTPRDDKGELIESRLGAGGQPFKGPWGVSVSRNLTPDAAGLKSWSDAQIAQAIRTGVRPDGQALKPPMGFGFYSKISDADMKALIAYLRSLKPQKP
ncbi:c-type cytochrome [Pelomonas sp. SE-A7]|uniref:c-type cytochrome n=1 Tax=Pelomonas sp. SE-A7 TaxID=3054953 RepID=UPI00259CD5A8|nr:c-type cytochrome [Pelomonas sp. SE-A7]MDM4767245.1 c-type cytochrome [Pelomonas sp. SE-A7]